MPTALRSLEHPRRRTIVALAWIAATGAALVVTAALTVVVSRLGATRVGAAGAALLLLALLTAGFALVLPTGTGAIRGRVGLVTAAGSVLALALLSQVLVPALVERQMRGRLASLGDVESLELSAFPAVGLAWGAVDEASIRMGSIDATKARSGGGGDGDMVEQAERVERLELAVDRLSAGPLEADDVRVTKHGDELRGTFTIDSGAIAAMIGGGAPGLEVDAKAVDGGLQLTLGGAPLQGRRIKMRIYADGGRIMSKLQLDAETAQAMGIPAGTEPPAQPMFGNDRVAIDSLAAREQGDRLALELTGRLAGSQETA
jgi:hypothetical protein